MITIEPLLLHKQKIRLYFKYNIHLSFVCFFVSTKLIIEKKKEEKMN
jgi:hypothetical protein